MRPILGRKFSSQLLLAGFGIGARLAPQTDAHRLSMSAVIGIGIYAPEPSALPDSLNPPDIGDHASRVFEPSMTAHKGAETGMSFIITKAQKAELQRLGYSEEQIREMKPEDAHRALGLIS